MELLHTVKGPNRSGVVWVSGEIDMSSIADLTERLGRVPDPLLLNLSQVEFLDASGCGVLVAERRRREATGGWLRILATSRAVDRIFDVAGLYFMVAAPAQKRRLGPRRSHPLTPLPVSEKGEIMPDPNVHDATTDEQASKEARAAGVERMLSGQDPPTEPEVNDPDPPREVGGASQVGQSITKRGEDVAADKEPGRADTGTDDTFAQRPHGTSTARDRTGVNPQEPIEDTPIE